MLIKDILSVLESVAPVAYQESYDNAGLITGDIDSQCSGVLICLDCIESVVEEALSLNCNLIVAHHPIVFSGLKKLTGKNYIERTLIKAIRNDIAIYAVHTNLDNMYHGVNYKIAEMLGLQNLKILEPKPETLYKLITFVPKAHREKVLDALFEAGAGRVGNYSECSYSSEGYGTFTAGEYSRPFVGKHDLRHTEEEYKIEVIFPTHLQQKVVTALLASHPYEEVAYDIIALQNTNPYIGAGIIGKLQKPMGEKEFLLWLKNIMNTNSIRFTPYTGKEIHTVALCGGAGSFLLQKAIYAGAQAFISGDFKYHQFFDAEGKILIADIGHYESEQFTMQLFYDILFKKFPNFALHLTKHNTNPVNYI